MNSKERREIIAQSPITYSYLRKFNIAAGILHLIQGALMLYLGLTLEWERDIYTLYIDFNIISLNPPVFEVLPNPEVAFTLVSLGAILASFPLLSSLAHLLIAFPNNEKYNENLKKGINPYRWYEYALSSSIMIVLICLLTGIWELWSLVMVFILNASTMLFGYLMEKLNQYTEKTDWTPFIYGCIAGFTPWIILSAYFISAISSTGLEPPTFVYYIIGFYLVVFNIFAVNMVLQYRGVGPWRDYLYGERFYIILSFVAKTALSWIIFVGLFAPF